MSTQDQILHTPETDEAYAMADTPDGLATAVRMSGKMLAAADSRWSKLRNENAPRDAELTQMMACGVCHADLLFRAGAYADAYSVAVALMLPPTLDDRTGQNALAILALTVIALMSLQTLAADMPHDEHNAAHMPVAINYLASLCYAYYRLSAQPSPESVWHGRAYPFLRDAASEGMVSTPTVSVNGRQEDPARPGNIVGDLVGRSVALGLMQE